MPANHVIRLYLQKKSCGLTKTSTSAGRVILQVSGFAVKQPQALMHPFCLRKTIIQPRLFQQACRLASTNRRVLKPRPTAQQQQQQQQQTTAPRPQDKDDDDESDSIRWYEKDVETGEVRRVAGNPEELEAKELRQKIKALEAELQEYKSERSDEPMLAALEPAERAKVERALRERKEKEMALTGGLELSLELPPLSVPLLKRLNASLHDAAMNPTSTERRKELWRWYSRGKHNIPALPRMMPAKAWDVLWQTQAVPSPTNPERLQHISQILGDMISVGQPLTREQKYAYIDTLLELNNTDLALQRWQEEYSSGHAPRHKVLELGISIFIRRGDLNQAHRILQEALKRYPEKDPRIILTLIGANVEAGNDHMAFALYLLLRSCLGGKMGMEEYDAVALLFLNNKKKDLALAVFRDMMLHGKEALRRGFFDQDKQDHLYQALLNRIDVLQSSATSPLDVNNVSLAALSAMPHQWQNKYFYGSWLKRLIGLGQLDAATKVVEIMYERGIDPDTKHINGLIGAFLRSYDPELQERGVSLGWSMIQQRLNFTFRRREGKRQEHGAVVPSIHETNGDLDIPTFVARRVPRASMETFNVLVLHYVVKEKWAHVRHLHRMLRPAEYNMDSFFMNHLLQTEFYTNGQQVAWRSFIKYAKSVSPDMETYRFLWTAELNHVDRQKTQERSGFPLPRQLMSVMLTWLSSLDEKQVSIAKEAFDIEIYAKIMQSFCSDSDFAGGLVAVHALAQRLGHYPDHSIAQVLTTAVSNIPEAVVPTIRGRRGRKQLPVSQARFRNTAKVLSTLANRRATVAMEHGIDLEKLDPEERVEENLNLLSEFIRIVLVRSADNPETVEASIEQAAEEIGVPGISTGDVDASNVL